MGEQTKVTCQNPGKHVMLPFEDDQIDGDGICF